MHVLACNVDRPGLDFMETSAGGVDVYMPVSGRRGANLFVVGQRLVPAAVGGPAGIPVALTWSSSTFQFSAVAGPAAGGALIALTNHAVRVYLFTAVRP